MATKHHDDEIRDTLRAEVRREIEQAIATAMATTPDDRRNGQVDAFKYALRLPSLQPTPHREEAGDNQELRQ
jgi:hypothetical protein